jgi:hypothetical protein
MYHRRTYLWLILISFVVGLQAQPCLPKGPLLWLNTDGFRIDSLPKYAEDASIKAIFFSLQKMDTVPFQLTLNGQLAIINYPSKSLSQLTKWGNLMPFSQHFYLLSFSPASLSTNEQAHRALSQFMIKAGAGQQQLLLDYSMPDLPSVKGCIALKINPDSNKYIDLEQAAFALDQLPILEAEILAHQDSLNLLEGFRKRYWSTVLVQRDSLLLLKDTMAELSPIYKDILLELTDRLDNITYAKQQLSSGLIEDESRVDYLFHNFEAALLRYRALPLVDRADDLFARYRLRSAQIQATYFSISDLQQRIRNHKLKLKDLEGERLVFRKRLGLD